MKYGDIEPVGCFNGSDRVLAENMERVPVGDAAAFKSMDCEELYGAVMGIANRVFAETHPNRLAIEEMCARFKLHEVTKVCDSLVDKGLVKKVGDRYYAAECAPE